MISRVWYSLCRQWEVWTEDNLPGEGPGRTPECFDPVASGRKKGEEKEEKVSVDLTDLKEMLIGADVD